MEDVKLDDERGHHWRMFFENNDRGVDDNKALLHAKMWYVYMNEKEKVLNGGYSVEVSVHDGKKFLWEVLYNHVI